MLTKDSKPTSVTSYDIVYLALKYVTSDMGYIKLGSICHVSKSSIGEYFNYLLPQINPKLAKIVHEKAAWHLVHRNESWTYHKFHKARVLEGKLENAANAFRRFYRKPQNQPKNPNFNTLIWNKCDPSCYHK